MEVNTYILIIIIGSAIVTFIPRVLPLMILSRLSLPDWIMSWLNHVPVAVMAALVGQELLLSDGKLAIFDSLELLAAMPTFLVAIISRSLLATVITGIISMTVVRFFF